MISIALRYAVVWILLLLLLIATAGSSYLDLGGKGAVLHLGVAGLQVLLVWLLFMNLLGSKSVIRLCAISALLWISFLFALTFSDYFTRGWNERPTRYPEDTATRSGVNLPLKPSNRNISERITFRLTERG
ncbi:MAG: hypothetical protein ACR650_16120 [Methylocystis sp.]